MGNSLDSSLVAHAIVIGSGMQDNLYVVLNAVELASAITSASENVINLLI